jgi:nitrite reductase (NADH) large subunit
VVERLVVIGNGMAGVRGVEEILGRAPGRYAITMFGAEPHGGYNRILLSPVLAGERDFAGIVTHDRAWYDTHGIELIAGEPVVGIDRARCDVRGALGTTRSYDKLLLATGSDPVILPVPGATLPGVIGFRSIADVETMRAACRQGGRAVVIGGGLLGLEAAYGLSRNSMTVTVLHLTPHLMERQLDPEAARMLADTLRARGISVITEARTRAVLGTDHAEGVVLESGQEIPADLVVMAVGVRPNIALARDIGLDCGRGLRVDDTMRTSDPAILALGECVEHRNEICGLLPPIWDMARVVADQFAGAHDTRYAPGPVATRLKVTGIDTFSAGAFLGDAETETITYRDRQQGVCKRLVLRAGRLVGVVLLGDTRDSGWYFDLLSHGDDVTALRDGLAFGPEGVAALPSNDAHHAEPLRIAA